MTLRRVVAALGGLAAVAGLVLFALYNEGQTIVLRFGLATWRGEAVHALYAAVSAGLLAMFLAGLPADLAGRRRRPRSSDPAPDDPAGD